MITSQSSSSVLTFARLELLKVQVERTLRRVGGTSESFHEKILRAVDERMIGEISFYGIDRAGYCRCQLELVIDWQTHELEISRGKATVVIDGRWRDSTAIELDTAIELFNRYVSHNGLRTKCHIRYARGVDGVMADRKLGFQDAPPLRWAEGGTATNHASIPELRELRVGLKLLDR